MTNRDAETPKCKSRSDDTVKPGASAPGRDTDETAYSPAGATSGAPVGDVAPAGLNTDRANRSPGADAPGYTMPPVPGCNAPYTVDEARLVDFVDGELTGIESRNLEAHVNQCPDCRARVAALRASLAIAQDIWSDASAAIVDDSMPIRRLRWQPAAAVGGMAAAVLIGCLWMVADRQPENQIPEPLVVEADVPPAPTDAAKVPADWHDMETAIARQVRSARLAASARVLADDPQLKTYHDSAQRYLANAFGEDESAGAVPTGIEQEI